MLRLEHVNMVVTNMETSLQFYKACFAHWNIRTKGNANWHGTRRNCLHFGDDYHYLPFNDMRTGEPRDLSSNQVGLAHLGFEVDKFSTLHQRLHKALSLISKALSIYSDKICTTSTPMDLTWRL
jgi:catechol-2,3-dioxygenase